MVGLMVQRAQHEGVQPMQFGPLGRRNLLDICQVGKRACPETEHRHLAVQGFHWCYFEGAYPERAAFVNTVQFDLRCPGVAVLGLKNISEALLKFLSHCFGTVHRHISSITEVEGPHIIQADDVVIVLMGEQYGI